MPPSLGFPRRFGDRHVLLKELGRGRTGRTYLAFGGGRLCAVKTLRPRGGPALEAADADELRRLVDEARLGTRLHHPNLIYVSEADVTRDPPFLVLEYVRGKSLRQVLDRCAEWQLAFPVGLALFVAREVLRALEHLHGLPGQDLVHRDVAPGNVLLSYDGHVKLADFGLARWRDRLAATMAGERWEAGPYQSPEQRRGLSLDARSDLWSAGLLLWEMLTGRRVSEVAGGTDGRIPPPSQISPSLPPDVDALVMPALAPDPDDRYPGAAAFAARLTVLMSASQDESRLKAFMDELFEAEQDHEAEEELRLQSAAARMPAGEAPEAVDDSAPIPAAAPPPAEGGKTAGGSNPGPRPPGDTASAAPSAAAAELERPAQGARMASGVSATEKALPGRARPTGTRWYRPVLVVMGLCLLVLAGVLALPRHRGTVGRGDEPDPEGAPESIGQTTAAKEAMPAIPPAEVPSQPPPMAVVPEVAPDPVRAPAAGRRPARAGEARREATVAQLVARAEDLYRHGRLVEAMNHGRAAVEAGGGTAARLMLAKTYLQMERFDQARAEYAAILRQEPDNLPARKGLAAVDDRQVRQDRRGR